MNRAQFNKKQQEFIKRYERKRLRRKSDINQPQIGHIYIFNYPRAKVAEYWDAYPLSLIIAKDRKYLLGLSLHYLPPRTRKYFVQKVLVRNYSLLKKGKPAYVPYGEIKAARDFWYKEGMAIIRKYIRKRIRGHLTEIPYTEWMNIISGEGAQWINITAAKIYRITKKQIKSAYEKAEVEKRRKKKKYKKPGKKKRKSSIGEKIEKRVKKVRKRYKRKKK